MNKTLICHLLGGTWCPWPRASSLMDAVGSWCCCQAAAEPFFSHHFPCLLPGIISASKLWSCWNVEKDFEEKSANCTVPSQHDVEGKYLAASQTSVPLVLVNIRINLWKSKNLHQPPNAEIGSWQLGFTSDIILPKWLFLKLPRKAREEKKIKGNQDNLCPFTDLWFNTPAHSLLSNCCFLLFSGSFVSLCKQPTAFRCFRVIPPCAAMLIISPALIGFSRITRRHPGHSSTPSSREKPSPQRTTKKKEKKTLGSEPWVVSFLNRACLN